MRGLERLYLDVAQAFPAFIRMDQRPWSIMLGPLQESDQRLSVHPAAYAFVAEAAMTNGVHGRKRFNAR